MLRKLVPIAAVVLLAVGLLVTLAFADGGFRFLPLIAKASDGLASLVRVEDNVVAGERLLAFRGPLGNLYIADAATKDVWFAVGWWGDTLEWPGAENLEWTGETLYVRFPDGTLAACGCGGKCDPLKIPIPPRPTPTETPVLPPWPTPAPTPTCIIPIPTPTPR